MTGSQMVVLGILAIFGVFLPIKPTNVLLPILNSAGFLPIVVSASFVGLKLMLPFTGGFSAIVAAWHFQRLQASHSLGVAKVVDCKYLVALAFGIYLQFFFNTIGGSAHESRTTRDPKSK